MAQNGLEEPYAVARDGKGWDGTGSRQILQFESHGFLENHVFLPTKQVETNIC